MHIYIYIFINWGRIEVKSHSKGQYRFDVFGIRKGFPPSFCIPSLLREFHLKARIYVDTGINAHNRYGDGIFASRNAFVRRRWRSKEREHSLRKSVPFFRGIHMDHRYVQIYCQKFIVRNNERKKKDLKKNEKKIK